MNGKTSAARQDSAGGHTRHVEATRLAPPLVGDPRTGKPSRAVRIPPFMASQDNSWARQWPLRSFLELGAFPGAVPCARLHARQILWEWRLASLSDIVELLVSELVTNAVQISCTDAQTTPIRLWMMANRTRLLILVWDSSPLPPVPMSSRQDDENGRGLLLVETLSTQWDWYFPPQDNGGKVVWALVGLTADHGDSGSRYGERTDGTSPAMTSPPHGHSHAGQQLSGSSRADELTPVLAVAAVAALPSRPRQDAVGAGSRTPVDPEILRRVKSALDRL
jgi:anti-sigma regulatory factor (Ser/Thr protein kinase)